MKQILVILLAILFLAGCSQQALPADNQNSELITTTQIKESTISEENLDRILSAVKESVANYDCTVYVDDNEGKVDVDLFMNGGMTEWIFADCVYAVTDSARKSIEECKELLGTITISFVIKKTSGEDEVLRWKSSDYDTGTLVDSKDKFTKIISLEELAERYNYEPISR